MARDYTDFPKENIKKLVWHIYPRKGIVSVNGFMIYNLKELKKIPLNDRLSFPPKLFKAIHTAK